ncbi:hypothetical protein Dsin_019470 [Dipteronia sinensis]|uniref:Reverse transcriptase domain-containing protein n=1 Tax=Dipteronia sinensis TaxID=43782 RepID=A0AAE0E420_9ROSI|nr:hypothetical protein Dsin_019470 [Dipteronia sinensis]
MGSWKAIHGIECKLEKMMVKDEAYWKQRSMVNWLKGGNRNTKFYNWKASSRKQMVFCGSTVDQVIACLQPQLSQCACRFLDEAFTSEKILKAVFDMVPTKALGPDGLPALFYHKFWDIVWPKVIASLAYFNEGGSFQCVNDTLICLIPKGPSVQRIIKYLPISICNVIYKIMAKAMSNRLQCVIGEVVLDSQSVFIPGRLITDNVNIGHECIQVMQTKRRKKGSVELKLAMSKAYNRVEWCFVEKIMLKLGFSERWVRLVMRCVSTVTYSFLVNVTVYGTVRPNRGLR